MLALCLTFIDDTDDKDLFENLFYSYRKQMVCLALSYIHNREDAEDVVHDVFINIAQRYMPVIKSIANETDMRNYLLKATKNTALNRVRKNRSNTEYLKTDGEALSDGDFTDRICEKGEYAEVLGAIKELNEKYRSVLYYHFVLEIPVKQVAKMLNLPVSTVKKQLVRGKKTLLKMLNKEERLCQYAEKNLYRL